jgi:hypothetical protein
LVLVALVLVLLEQMAFLVKILFLVLSPLLVVVMEVGEEAHPLLEALVVAQVLVLVLLKLEVQELQVKVLLVAILELLTMLVAVAVQVLLEKTSIPLVVEMVAQAFAQQ